MKEITMIQNLLDIPLKLRTGMKQTVAEQIIHSYTKRICNADDCRQTDRCRSGFCITHVRDGERDLFCKPFLCELNLAVANSSMRFRDGL